MTRTNVVKSLKMSVLPVAIWRKYTGPATFGDPAVGQKYKVRENVPLWKKNSKIFSPEGPHENVWGSARMLPWALLWLSTGLRPCIIYHSESSLIPATRQRWTHPTLTLTKQA